MYPIYDRKELKWLNDILIYENIKFFFQKWLFYYYIAQMRKKHMKNIKFSNYNFNYDSNYDFNLF